MIQSPSLADDSKAAPATHFRRLVLASVCVLAIITYILRAGFEEAYLRPNWQRPG